MTEIGWNRPPPPGFQGLRPDLPIEVYMRNLPHWRQEGATYFVTYRLADSLPESKLRELSALNAEWERRHRPPFSEEVLQALAREAMERVERWLDEGHGSCLLRDKDCAARIVDSMPFFDGDRYELGCYVVMPNHVHVIVRPLQPRAHPLGSILQSWKRHTSYKINRQVGRSGTL